MSTPFAERPAFFEGQYLGADDLQALLGYCREQLRRHQLGGHTWGVLAGLELVEVAQADGSTQTFITPGLAVDGYGRLVHVPAPHALAAGDLAGLPDGEVPVWLRYVESPGAGVRPGFETCGSTDAYERAIEGYAIEFGDRPLLRQHQSGVWIGDNFYADAREATGAVLPLQPLASDGAVPMQAFPATDEPNRWSIPLGSVLYQGGLIAAPTAASRKTSRLRRRNAGLVGEAVLGSQGLLRLGPRLRPLQPGQSADDADAALAPKPADLVYALADADTLWPRFREPIWLQADTRAAGHVRHYGSRSEWVSAAGTDYQAGGLVTALRRNASGPGVELQLLLGPSADADTPTRLAVGAATVLGADPLSLDFSFTARTVVQSNGRVGIGATDKALSKPLTVRAEGATADLLELQTKAGALAWQMNLGAAEAGLNITRADATQSHLFVANGGNVGVATATPEAKLDIRGLPPPAPTVLGQNKWLQIGNGNAPDEGRVWLQYGPAAAPLWVMSDFDDPSRLQFQQVGNGQEAAPQWASWLGLARSNSADLTISTTALGVNTQQPQRTLHVEGNEIHSGGPGGGLSFSNRESGFVMAPGAGERWVWYAAGGVARLWSGDDKLAVTSGGRLGIGTAAPSESLDVMGSVRLGANTRYHAVGGLTDARIIAGRYTGGAIQQGPGWRVLQIAQGQYVVQFLGGFATVPVVVATPEDSISDDNVLTVRSVQTDSFQVMVKNALGSEADKYENTIFNFIAYGPRA